MNCQGIVVSIKRGLKKYWNLTRAICGGFRQLTRSQYLRLCPKCWHGNLCFLQKFLLNAENKVVSMKSVTGLLGGYSVEWESGKGRHCMGTNEIILLSSAKLFLISAFQQPS